jgi:hypothetical protein
MTEIQWLCDLLLNCKLPKKAKERFIARIGEVESKLSPQPHVKTNLVQSRIDQAMNQQVDQVAQTAIAQKALEDRQLAIKVAASGKPEPGRTSPRKF